VPCPIDLLNGKADLGALVCVVKEAEQTYAEPCRMIVIDTLSRALSGGEENTSADMGAFVKNVDELRERTRAAIEIVHHGRQRRRHFCEPPVTPKLSLPKPRNEAARHRPD
jgi:RecA-family ATPase